MKCTGKEWDHCRVEKMGCIGCYYDEIEAGEYIRTDKGNIFEIDKKKKVISAIKFLDVQYGHIINHKKKLVDLVKVGDYVNGYRIVKIRIDPFNNKKQLFTEHWEYNWQGDGTLLVFYDEDIKIVTTKEQFDTVGFKKKRNKL